MSKVKNVVLEYRRKKSVTQKDLAEATDVTRQTIIAIEKGNYTPSVELALKIAQFFNISVEKLFTLD